MLSALIEINQKLSTLDSRYALHERLRITKSLGYISIWTQVALTLLLLMSTLIAYYSEIGTMGRLIAYQYLIYTAHLLYLSIFPFMVIFSIEKLRNKFLRLYKKRRTRHNEAKVIEEQGHRLDNLTNSWNMAYDQRNL